MFHFTFDRLYHNVNYVYDNGSHQSGKDLTINNINISSKSCKETKKYLNISSYRLTTCSTITEFVEEIDIKRNNYDYYMIISRYEDKLYNIYVIPAILIKASDKNWNIKYKRNNKNEISCWNTEEKNGISLSIKKSMSNQLWINIDKNYYNNFCIMKNIKISHNKILNYCDLYNIYN